MQPLSSILFQFPVQGDYGVSRGAASRLARVYARERAVACKRALARVCATLIACAAAAQKPNELECLLSCLRSPLCARLPARLSPRVRFETRIKQTALMPDPCRSVPSPPLRLHLLFFPPLVATSPRGRRAIFSRDLLIAATRNRDFLTRMAPPRPSCHSTKPSHVR